MGKNSTNTGDRVTVLAFCTSSHYRLSVHKVSFIIVFLLFRGRSGGAMVLGKLPVPGRPTIWVIVGQGPIALAVGAGGGCLDIFTLRYLFSSVSPYLWEAARYRLKYYLKGPLNPKQPTNQILLFLLWPSITVLSFIWFPWIISEICSGQAFYYKNWKGKYVCKYSWQGYDFWNLHFLLWPSITVLSFI